MASRAISAGAALQGRGAVREFAEHKKSVHALAWNCTGTRLATGSVDATAHVWTGLADDGKGREAHVELKGHQDGVEQLCWDPYHPDRLATASGDRTLRIWDARAARCTTVVETKGENINAAWSREHHIAVGSKEDDLTVVDARKGKALKVVRFPYEVNEMTWEPSGAFLFLSTGMGTVEVVDYGELIRTGKADSVRSLHGHTANCYCVKMSPCGDRFASGGADALVSVWSLPDLVCTYTLTRLEWPVRTISFSHDGALLASGSEDAFIDVADSATGDQVASIPNRVAMNSIAWHPSAYLLAFAGDYKDRDEGMFRVFGYPSS